MTEKRDKQEDLKVVDRFWKEISFEETESVVQEYPILGKLEQILFQSFRPLSAGCLFRTSVGEFFLKRNSTRIRKRDEWEYEHRLLQKISGMVPGLHLPRILLNQNQSTLLEKTWEGETYLYEIQTKAVGEDLYRNSHTWSPFFILNHSSEIGKTLAHLHHAIRNSGFQGSRNPAYQKARFEIFYTEDLCSFLQDLTKGIPGFSGLRNAGGFVEKTCGIYKPFLPPLPDRQKVPREVVHSDPQASNFFWNGGKASSLIDFHLLNENNYLYDLAVAVDRNCIYWLDLLSGKENSYHIEGARGILESYRSTSRELGSPLPGWDLLVSAIVLHRIEFALDLCNYYLNVENSVFKAQWCLDVYVLAHGEWLGSDPGKRFLDSIL